MNKLSLRVFALLCLLLTAGTISAQTVFSCDFEDATQDAQWILRHGNQAVKSTWWIGSAVHAGTTGNRALYISNDSATTNAYTNATGVANASSAFARRLITFADSGWYTFEYDWRCKGYSTTYYMRAVLIPAGAVQPRDTTSIITGLSATALPMGWISVDSARLNLNDTWQHKKYTVMVPKGNYYLAFYWRNASSTTNYNPPAAVDNIVISHASGCLPPHTLLSYNVTATTTTLDVRPADISNAYLLHYWDEYHNVDTTVEVYFPVTLTDLTPASVHWYSIRKLCGNDTSSVFQPSSSHWQTECYFPTMPWNHSFESSTYWYHTGSKNNYPRWPTCWNAIDGGSDTYNWRQNTSVTNAHTGTYSWSFSGVITTNAAQHDDWLITPQMNLTGDELISFWMKSGNATTTAAYMSRVRIAVSSDSIRDTNNERANFDFIPLGQSNGSKYISKADNQYEQFTVRIQGYTGLHYLAFVVDTPSYTFYIDDIRLATRSNCPDAYNPRVVQVLSDSVRLAWTDTASSALHHATSWDVYIGAPGFIIDTVMPITVTDSMPWIGGLAPGRDYEFMVAASCADGSMANTTVPIGFRTACAVVSTAQLPYRENFDGVTGGTAANTTTFVDNVPCWRGKHSTANTYYPHLFTTSHHSGTNSLRFYGSGAAYCWAALPMFEEPISNLQMSFQFLRYNSTAATYTSNIIVGVMSDPMDISTFDTVAQIDLFHEAGNQWYPQEVLFDNYRGTGRYLAFLCPGGTSVGHTYNYAIIDDVVVERIPSCRRPVNVRDSLITATTALIAWDSSAVNYEVVLSTTPNFNPDTVAAARRFTSNTNSVSLTNLQTYTYYYACVRGFCSSTDTSRWSMEHELRSGFDCGVDRLSTTVKVGRDTTLQSFYDFYTNTAATLLYPSVITYHLFSPAELEELGVYTNSNISSLSLRKQSTAATTIRKMRIYIGETDTADFDGSLADSVPLRNLKLVYSSPAFNFGTGWTEIVFDSSYTYSGRRNLVVVTMRDTAATGVSNFYYYPTSNYKVLSRYKTNSTTVNHSTVRSMYRSVMKFTVCNRSNITCMYPTSVRVLDVDSNSIVATWHGTAPQYQTMAVLAGVDPSTAPATQLHTCTGTTDTIRGLLPNTLYDVYVRSVCSGSATSEWSYRAQVSTTCVRQSLPFTEDFNSYVATTTALTTEPLSVCWKHGYQGGTSEFPYVYSNYGSNGSNSLRFYNTTAISCYAALPLMSAPINQLYMSLNAYRSAATARLIVGVMSNPEDLTTFVPVDTINSTTMNQSEPVRVMFTNYTGTGEYIAFYAPQGSAANVYVDDIMVNRIPSCDFGSVPVPTNITTNSVELQWNGATQQPLAYEVVVYQKGLSVNDTIRQTTTTTSATISGLTMGESYYAVVRNICGAGDTGDWSFPPMPFNAQCGVISEFPYHNNFESCLAGTTAPFVGCWTRTNDYTSSTYPYVVSGTNAYEGNNCLTFYVAASGATSATKELGVMPALADTVNISNLQLDFFAKGGTAAGQQLVVGVMRAPDTISTFTPIDTLDLLGSYQEFVVELTRATNAMGRYVAFMVQRGTTLRYAYVDNVSLEVIPTCPRPIDLKRETATAHSVTLSWQDRSSARLWEVEYTDEEGHVSIIPVESNPAFIGGLQEQSKYYFRVRGICGGGDSSMWSMPLLSNTRTCAGSEASDDYGNWTSQATAIASSNFRHSYQQIIFDSAELATLGGSISAMEYYAYNSNVDTFMTDAIIYIGHTTKQQFATTSDWVVLDSAALATDVKQVYAGNLSHKEGWNIITFDSTFTWDGHRNVVLVVKRDRGSKPIKAGSSYATSTPAGTQYRMLYQQNDNNMQNPANPTLVGTRVQWRPVINLLSCGGCDVPAPELSIDHTTLTMMMPQGSTYQYSMRANGAMQWTDTTTDSTTTQMVGNLLPLTRYYLRVREMCDGDYTPWSLVSFVTEDILCEAPTHLRMSTMTGTTAMLHWDYEAMATRWELNVYNASMNVFDTIEVSEDAVNLDSTLITRLSDGETYHVAVRSICTEVVASPWSDTLEFTTPVCDTVSDISVVAGHNTARVVWTPGTYNGDSWEVLYGMRGFIGEEGTSLIVSVPEAILDSLLEQEDYDVYVRAICGENFTSTWSTVEHFTTTTNAIEEADGGLTAMLTPNPASHSTKLTVSGIDGQVNVAIVDLNGRTIRTLKMMCSGDCSQTMDITMLPAGAYFVRISSGDINVVRRLVVR